MFRDIHTLEPDLVIEYYLATKGVSKKHSKNIRRVKQDLINDTKIYQKLAVSGKFHEVKKQISNVDEEVSKSLKVLYDAYVKKSGVTKFIFKQSHVCAGCQKSYATERSTKDHFLPSSVYPNFFVLPWNLIPICGDCNRAKNDAYPKNSKENLPHPYFNGLLFKKNWIKVVIKEVKPLKFELAFDKALRASEKQMVLNHLVTFKLEGAFNSHMSTLFDEIDDELRDTFKANGAANLKAYLR
ncbi:HNH endonuclease [Vibrio splendidus]